MYRDLEVKKSHPPIGTAVRVVRRTACGRRRSCRASYTWALSDWLGRWGEEAVGVGLVLATVYAALMGTFWGQGQGGFDSLAGVQALFAHPGLLLGGWIHYLAFDLLVCTWEREQAAVIGLSRWLLVPCLFMTFMFGPVGWLLFMAMRFVRTSMMARTAEVAG